MKPHSFHPDAAAYYAGIEPELGGRFYDEMERLIQDIRKQPNLFRLWSPPIRRRPDYWKRRLK